MIKELRRVVITDMGAISPLRNTVETLWKNIAAGKSGVGLITRFDTAKFKTKFAAEVKGSNAPDYFEKNEARKYDLFRQYAVAATDEAIMNAGINFENLNRTKIGVIWGSGNGGIQTFDASEIDYINAHVTSTHLGDEGELKAIMRLFSENKNLNISATESMTGHLLGVAGSIEAIISVKAIQNNLVPPTINTTEVEPAYRDKFNLTLSKAQSRQIYYAMSSMFGFGEHIATIILKQYN